MTKTKLYIAGPMRGVQEFNFPAFFRAEEKLRKAGYDVVNPARHDVEAGFKYQGLSGTEDCSQYGLDVIASLDWDLRQILDHVDGVAVLDLPWITSEGTRLEVGLAYTIEIPIAYANAWEDYNFARSKWNNFDDWMPSPAIRKRISDWLHVKPEDGVQVLKDTYKLYSDTSDGGIVVSTDFSDSYSGVNDTTCTHIQYGTFGAIPDQTISFPKDAPKSLWVAQEPHGTEEVRTVSASGGEKGVKPARYDLIPVGPLKTVAEHYGIGAKKYADRNWEKGYEWGKSYAAMQRHANQFWGGEDIDEETGSPHLAAVVFHALALLEFANTHPEYDDRAKK